MDAGAAFWIFVIALIAVSMVSGASSKSSSKSSVPSEDAPRRIIIETLDNRGQVVKRESAHIASGPVAGAQGAPKSRPYDDAARRADLAQFEKMRTR